MLGASPMPASILKTAKPAKPAAVLPASSDMMDLDLSSDAGDDAPSPQKRPRVQFSEPDADADGLPVDRAEKSAAVIREEVRRAIQRHLAGADREAYDRVKEIFAADPRRSDDDGSLPDGLPSHATLKHHLMGLLANVASLDRSCAGLVHAVLGSQWLGRDQPYVKLFIRFLGNLAAAQGSYLGSVLKMLVNYLGAVPKGTGRLPGYAPVSNAEIYARTHMALHYVMQLIPAGSGALSPILSMQPTSSR
ncbi:hypothetical protein VTN02DRAFT_1233 [Thermoascus thermophilus]